MCHPVASHTCFQSTQSHQVEICNTSHFDEVIFSSHLLDERNLTPLRLEIKCGIFSLKKDYKGEKRLLLNDS